MNEQLFAAVSIILLVLCLVAIAIGITNRMKINSILDYSDEEEGSLVDNLKKYYNAVSDMQKKFKNSQAGAMNDKLSECTAKINMTLSKTAVVTFDAFDDVRGKQSFALAVLNQYNDGFVLTSLYGSSSSNTYVRKVKNGKSDIKLLPEEQQAISNAMEQSH